MPRMTTGLSVSAARTDWAAGDSETNLLMDSFIKAARTRYAMRLNRPRCRTLQISYASR